MNEIVSTIDEFDSAIELIEKFSNMCGYVFRGQSTGSWKLKPSIFRCRELYVAVGEHLERFKKYSVGRIRNIESYSDNELWAIGQHYGLKTPLLDWSASAAIGLYFSFESKIENNEKYASFYALNAKELNKEFCTRLTQRQKEISPEMNIEPDDLSMAKAGKMLIDIFEKNPNLDENLVEMDVLEKFARMFSPKKFNNSRILSQRGIFSITQTGKPLEEILENNGLSNICEKYLISAKLKDKIIQYLDAHNINQLSLYPDVTGAALYSNQKINRFEEDDEVQYKTEFWL